LISQSRIEPPAAQYISIELRALHIWQRIPDIVRAYQRDFSMAPDLVAFPETEQDIIDVLDWCSSEGVAIIPYGGGSSVVKGTEPDVGDGYKGVVTIDMKRLDKVLEVDSISRAANIQAGIYGPALENGLRPHGLTLRHFPQSFEYSTLGGWIATVQVTFCHLYTH
jgi:alkyldihydroxyacetonephosphate synthase